MAQIRRIEMHFHMLTHFHIRKAGISRHASSDPLAFAIVCKLRLCRRSDIQSLLNYMLFNATYDFGP